MRFTTFVFSLALTALGGCAALPDDGGRDEAATLASSRGISAAAGAASSIADLKDGVLTAPDAVRIALTHNPALARAYAGLGFAAADVYEAGRLSNPTLSASALYPDAAGGSAKLTLGLVQNFTDLLFLRQRSRLARDGFEAGKKAVGAQAVALAAEAEAAWYELATAQHQHTLRQAAATVASLSAELAKRFADAGNLPPLELAQAQAAAAQARAEALESATEAAARRAALNRVMGFADAEPRWRLPMQLPLPLAQEDARERLLELANTRLDLVAARDEVRARAKALGLTRDFRYLGEVEIGVEAEREPDGARRVGPTLGFELPLFDRGEGRTARAQAELAQAESGLRELEVEAVAGVHAALARVHAARERVDEYRRALVPARIAASERLQEAVNFMLAGQFEMLEAKQAEFEAQAGLVAAIGDYWIARTALASAVGASLPSSTQAPGGVIDVAELVAPREAEAPDASGHEHHGDHQ